MYQQELFKRTIPTRRVIGDGCFGTVYSINDDWVVKYAAKDGTLNYLEWCKIMQDAGKHMRGMPEIDRIVHLDGDRYMVTMRYYSSTLRERIGREYYAEVDKVKATTWFKELKAAYLEYAALVLGEPVESSTGHTLRWADCHASNIMWDAREERYVVTDPCAVAYSKPKDDFPFQMYVEQPEQAPPKVQPEPPPMIQSQPLPQQAVWKCSDSQCNICNVRALMNAYQ